MARVLSEPEFNALKEKVLAALPAGLNEAQFQRAVGPRLAAAIGEAENSPAPLDGSALGRFASGVGEMLNPITMVKGAANAIAHPIDTATGVASQMTDQWSQAKQLAGEGRYTEAAAHGVAGMIPLVGPLSASIGERIGSGDVAGGLGQATGLLAPFNAPRLVKGVSRVVSPAMREAAAAALESNAAARVADVMSPKIGPNKVRFGNMAEKVAPELLERDAVGGLSRSGLHGHVQAGLEQAEHALDAASDARLNARTFPTAPIIQDLLKKRAALGAEAVEGSHPIPEVTGPAVRQVPVDPLQHYALRWMKEDMENIPFTKHTFNEIPVGKGGDMQITPGSAGAPIYRAIVGQEGRELIHATRGQVIQAIDDVMAGKTDGRLRQLVVGVADDLARGDAKTQRLMLTSGPSGEGIPATHTLTMKGKPTDLPTRTGRPLGQDVMPGPQGDRAAVIDQAIREIKQLGPVVRYDAIRRIRQAYDIPARAIYSPAVTADYLKAQGGKLGAADVTGTLRESLAKFDPETAKANASYALFKQADDVMQAADEIERVRPKVGRQILARGLGAAGGGAIKGGLGAVVGAVIGPTIEAGLSNLSPAYQLQSAKLLSELSQALRTGDAGRAISVRYRLRALAQAAIQIGRSTSPTESPSQTTVPVQLTAARYRSSTGRRR